jgi:hypothetical protein
VATTLEILAMPRRLVDFQSSCQGDINIVSPELAGVAAIEAEQAESRKLKSAA